MCSDHAGISVKDIPGTELQVVCDASASRSRAVADSFDVTDIATDPNAVLAPANVTAVAVASPDFTDAPLSLACIAAGKLDLCEKPLSQVSAE
jgi:myo-inositol 2-dehydrogenase / D-chiro-inositol 1-dehydrogenase